MASAWESLRVMIAASEAGSSKTMLPVIQFLRRYGAVVRGYLEPSMVSLSHRIEGLDGADIRTIEQFRSPQKEVAEFGPSVFYLGTTAREESLERQLSPYLGDQGILTIAVVDERYGFRRRFASSSGDLSFLPDVVGLMDHGCFRDAVAEGLPAEKLRITGSPILSYLYFRRSSIRVDTGTDYRHSSGCAQVVFLSETFRRDNGSSPGTCGLVGRFLGYTEDTVRADLCSVLTGLGRPVSLVEKMHPSDNSPVRKEQIREGVFWDRVRDVDLWSIVLQSDLVVGMRSMALTEAALLGCPTASYQPNLIGENNCSAVAHGLATPLEDVESLDSWVKEGLLPFSRQASLRTPDFLREDSAEQAALLCVGSRGAVGWK